jgi:predicted acylesterase/phospholipase RssA
MPAAEIAESYHDLGTKVFRRSWWEPLVLKGVLWGSMYQMKNLKDALYTIFADRIIADAQRRCEFMTYAAMIAPKMGSRHWKSWAIDPKSGITSVSNAVASSCAIQVFLSPNTVARGNYDQETFVDGGNISNNPTMHALADFPTARILNIQCLRPEAPIPRATHKKSLVQWAKYLVPVFGATDESAVEYQAQQFCGPGYHLVRLNSTVGITDVSNKAFEKMDADVTAAWNATSEGVLQWLQQ